MSPNIVLNPFSTVTPGNSVLLCHTHSRMTAQHGPLTDVDTTRLLPLADQSLTPCGIFLSQVQPHLEMEGEYKKIILLKGLEPINDYQFSIVKSVLARDLGLTANMQKEYNKVKIADLMEKKFPGVACVNKLIDLFKEMQDCEDIVINLRNGKRKGNGQEPSLSGVCPLRPAEPWCQQSSERCFPVSDLVAEMRWPFRCHELTAQTIPFLQRGPLYCIIQGVFEEVQVKKKAERVDKKDMEASTY